MLSADPTESAEPAPAPITGIRYPLLKVYTRCRCQLTHKTAPPRYASAPPVPIRAPAANTRRKVIGVGGAGTAAG